MALSEFRFNSPVLGKMVDSFIILPEVGTPPFATLYLLHGMSDDASGWMRRSRIEEHVKNLPLVVVMPDGFRGAYTNAEVGPAFATYLIQDLLGSVERNFNVKRTRDARAIGGNSMGGYGALRLGLGYPDLFSSVHSHSGSMLLGTLPPAQNMPYRRPASLIAEFELLFGKNPAGTAHDLQELVRRCLKENKLPPLHLDCGTDDFLLEQNRAFARFLQSLNIPHEYTEHPGGHEWDYWDQHIRKALAFHAANLKLS